jgi:hypothetical protein
MFDADAAHHIVEVTATLAKVISFHVCIIPPSQKERGADQLPELIYSLTG